MAGRRDPARGTPGRTAAMIWNLRLVAANHGIWKASEMQRRLAGHGLVISAGKMSGLWSGKPASLKLDDLDVICAVLGCGIEELLIPEPETVTSAQPAEQEPEAADGGAAGSAPATAAADRCPRCDRLDTHGLYRLQQPAGLGPPRAALLVVRPSRPARPAVRPLRIIPLLHWRTLRGLPFRRGTPCQLPGLLRLRRPRQRPGMRRLPGIYPRPDGRPMRKLLPRRGPQGRALPPVLEASSLRPLSRPPSGHPPVP